MATIRRLPTQDLDALAAGLRRSFPVDKRPCFEELLRAIDAADRNVSR
jgi:hypothetical protein